MTNFHTFQLVLLLIGTLSLSSPGVRAASEAADQKTPIHRDLREPATAADLKSTSSGGTTLVFFGVLLAGAVLFRRQVQQSRQRRMNSSQCAVKLLGRQQVDSELTLRFLQVGPRVLVVGSSPQGLATLAELTDPEEIALLIGDGDATNALFGRDIPLAGTKVAAESMPSARRESRIAAPLPTGG